MTRSTNVSAENEKSEKARAATKEAKDIPVEKKEVTGSRYTLLSRSSPCYRAVPVVVRTRTARHRRRRPWVSRHRVHSLKTQRLTTLF